MIEKLEFIDREIVHAINSWNSPFMDELMWIVSKIPTWIPLYLMILLLVYKKENLKTMLFFLLSLIVLIAITDQVSSSFFKPFFARYRPSHNLLIPVEFGEMHFYEFKPNEFYKGGQFGFISGHSSNSFAIAIFSSLALKKHVKHIMIILIIWASLVAYSRMYLGVHYLSDCIAGALVGSLFGCLVYKLLYKNLKKRFATTNQ